MDNNNEFGEFDPQDHEPHAVHITPIPLSQLIAQSQAEADRRLMAGQELRLSVARLFEEVSPEQAFTIYRLLNNIANNGVGTAQYISGELSAVLRYYHKVCQDCGASDHRTEGHIVSEVMKQEASNVATQDEIRRDVEEIRKAFNLHPEVMKYCERYNVYPMQEGDKIKFVCVECHAIYITLERRLVAGLECPSCKVQKVLSTENDSADEMAEYNTQWTGNAVNPNEVRCMTCENVFANFDQRKEFGHECPYCKLDAHPHGHEF